MTTNSERNIVNSAFDQTQSSPIMLNRDVDLRAQLVRPMNFVQSALIGGSINDSEIITAPLSITNHSEAGGEKSKSFISD